MARNIEEQLGLLDGTSSVEDQLRDSDIEAQSINGQELTLLFPSRRHDFQATKKANFTKSVRRRVLKACFRLIVIALCLLGIFALVELTLGPIPFYWRLPPQPSPLWPDWDQPGQPGEYLAHYPGDLTRDVTPIPCHSHNDYWRRIPLFEALHYGCTGVEADVWLLHDELFVGHNPAALTKNRTFRNLYVDPLRKILDAANPSNEFSNTTRHGVFDSVPEQSLVLLIDFKTVGRTLLPVVSDQLQALREKQYLTVLNGTTIIPGPITVVATGNAPFDLIDTDPAYADIFFDAPLGLMGAKNTDSTQPSQHEQGINGIDPLKGADQFNIRNSYYASTDFISSIGFPWLGHLTNAQTLRLRAQIRGAHERGLKARYWNTPSWPVGLRERIWKVLVDEGVDYLNVDDLYSATRGRWGDWGD